MTPKREKNGNGEGAPKNGDRSKKRLRFNIVLPIAGLILTVLTIITTVKVIRDFVKSPRLEAELFLTYTGFRVRISNTGSALSTGGYIEIVSWADGAPAEGLRFNEAFRNLIPGADWEYDINLLKAAGHVARPGDLEPHRGPSSGYIVISCSNCKEPKGWAFHIPEEEVVKTNGIIRWPPVGFYDWSSGKWPLVRFDYPADKPGVGFCVDFPPGSCFGGWTPKGEQQWKYLTQEIIEESPRSATVQELLAMLITTGDQGKPADKIAKQILNRFGSLQSLANQPHDKLADSLKKQLPAVKIARITAALKLAKKPAKEAVTGNEEEEAILQALITTGNQGKPADKIAEQILSRFGSIGLSPLEDLTNQSFERQIIELKIELPDVKVARIVAAFELAKRLGRRDTHNTPEQKGFPQP